MNLVEIIGNQHLRILALEETLRQREGEISQLQEKVMKLTPVEPKPVALEDETARVLGEVAADQAPLAEAMHESTQHSAA